MAVRTDIRSCNAGEEIDEMDFFVAVSNRNYLVSERWQLAVSSVWSTSVGSGSAGLRQLATTQFGHVDRDALGNVMESGWCRAPSTRGT